MERSLGFELQEERGKVDELSQKIILTETNGIFKIKLFVLEYLLYTGRVNFD